MLDDLKKIAHLDKSDTLGVAEKELQQLDQEFEIPESDFMPDNVVFAGMGGSALYADLIKSIADISVPYQVVRGYDIPAYVDEHTLFIASSFSGNTEETLSAITQAEEAGAHITVITGGGKLEERVKGRETPLAKLDTDIPQPRMATFNGLKALTAILEAYGVVEGVSERIAQARDALKGCTADWRPDVPTARNQAKQLAQELMGRSVVVYGGALTGPLARKWKISFNENAKNVAWHNEYPEFNHNEFIGWSEQPTVKPYALINLISNQEHERVRKRFEVSNKLLSGRWPHPNDVQLQGKNITEQILWGVMLGDFVSLYLAILNNVDPAPVELVERFKRELS